MNSRFTRKRKISSDKRGLEGLPLQLLIISMVLAIGLPAVYTTVEHYDTESVIQNVESQAEFIAEKAKQLHAYGAGNSEVISVDLEDGLMRSIKFLEVCNQTFRNLIQWETSGGNSGMLLLDNDITLFSEDPIKLGSGSHELKLECSFGDPLGSGEKMQYIEVSLV